MRNLVVAAGLGLCAIMGTSQSAYAQLDPYVGQTMTTAANYCPSGWFEMNGQILPIQGNEVLFTLLGTTYGGNGANSFQLPDTRGRAILGDGAGAGLPVAELGMEDTAVALSAEGPFSGTGPQPTPVNIVSTIVFKQCIAAVGVYPPRP